MRFSLRCRRCSKEINPSEAISYVRDTDAINRVLALTVNCHGEEQTREFTNKDLETMQSGLGRVELEFFE